VRPRHSLGDGDLEIVTDPRVAGLVYIAALAPDADETSQSYRTSFPRPMCLRTSR
jgi:hypothetical protein